MLLDLAVQAVSSLMDGNSSFRLSANFAKAVSASTVASSSADDVPAVIVGVVRSGVVRSGTIGVPPIPEVDDVARVGVSMSSAVSTIDIYPRLMNYLHSLKDKLLDTMVIQRKDPIFYDVILKRDLVSVCAVYNNAEYIH